MTCGVNSCKNPADWELTINLPGDDMFRHNIRATVLMCDRHYQKYQYSHPDLVLG